jgi:hypothetical protein
MPLNIARNTGLAAHAGLQRARISALAGAARRAARLLEQQGRAGDRHLVHVNDAELAAIRGAYGPAGRAGRRNPVTGLESFAPGEDTATGAAPEDGRFVGSNPDGSGYSIWLPLPSAAQAQAAFDVPSGYTQIYEGDKGRLLLVRTNGMNHLAVVELSPVQDGSGWTVTSAHPQKGTRAIRGKLVWDAARNTTSSASGEPARFADPTETNPDQQDFRTTDQTE